MRLLVLAALLLAVPLAAAAPSPDALLVEAQHTVKQARPQSVVTFPVNLTNRGSDPLLVSFLVDDGRAGDEAPAGEFTAPTPRPLTLKPGHRTVVMFAAQTPYENGRMETANDLVVRIRAADPDAPDDRTEVATLRLTVRTAGVYVPGAPLWSILALAYAAARLMAPTRGPAGTE